MILLKSGMLSIFGMNEPKSKSSLPMAWPHGLLGAARADSYGLLQGL